MRAVHMGSCDALCAHADLQASCSYAKHVDTFRLSHFDHREAEKKISKLLSLLQKIGATYQVTL
ncbi:MAG: hypothetical protein AAGF04_05755 [Chlamydiota bacterium]